MLPKIMNDLVWWDISRKMSLIWLRVSWEEENHSWNLINFYSSCTSYDI